MNDCKFIKKGIKCGFGTYGIGDKNIKVFCSDIDRANFLREVYKNGILFFDAAEDYHNGFSELLLGKAFKKNDDVIIATKISPNNYENNIEKSIDNSLLRLKRDYIDIIQLHWPNFKVSDEKIIDSLNKVFLKKKIKNVGLCNVTKKYLDRYLKLSKSNIPIKFVQNEYNIFERSVEKKLLNYCKKRKITFLAYSPFGSSKQVKKIFLSNFLNEISNIYKLKPTQVVLQWLKHMGVIPIFQTSKISNLKENIRFDNELIPNNLLDKISNKFKQKVVKINPKKIKIVESFSGKFYTNIDQAKKNLHNFSPSPYELAEEIKENDILKPVKLRKINSIYHLYEGQLRYWAWVLAFGCENPIEALVE